MLRSSTESTGSRLTICTRRRSWRSTQSTPPSRIWIDASGVLADIGEQDDARAREAFDGQPWSDFVNRHTRFSGWGEMLSTAGKEHVATQLFKGLR